MAEFCPKCWKALNDFDDPDEAYILSWGLELCEGCGEMKRVVVGTRKHYFLRQLFNRLFRRR